ncbi:MAG: cupredoxin domain-containing protein [Planctomycetota bacterium]|jgi:hypothetical protein
MRNAALPLLALALALAVCWPLVHAGPGTVLLLGRYSGGPVANGGSIKGVVTVDPVPSPAEFVIGKDVNVCEGAKANPRLVVDRATKGIGNVVVYLDGIEKGKPRPTGISAVIDQQGCQYTPHITIVPMKAKVSFRSSDPILHNVHVFKGTPDKPHARTADIANMAMKDSNVPNMPLSKRALRKPGFFYIRCDAGHIWMSAYLWVVEHPYYVLTDAKGMFELTDVPPGTYTLRYWHENWEATPVKRGDEVTDYSYGPPIRHSVQVTVKPGEAVTADWQIRAGK